MTRAMNSQKWVLFLKINLGVFVLFILQGCNSSQKQDKEHLVFKYNEHSNIATLDPAFARNPQTIWPSNQLFNGLVQLDDQLNIQPDIAKSWHINDLSLIHI